MVLVQMPQFTAYQLLIDDFDYYITRSLEIGSGLFFNTTSHKLGIVSFNDQKKRIDD